MKKFILLLFLTGLLISCSNVFSHPKKLFNGDNLDGWIQVGEGKFIVKNHLLQSVGGMGLLYYAKQLFGNVKLHVVYKVPYADTNSGIFVRIAHQPKDAWDAVHNGYEIQICDAGKDAFDAYHITGAVYTFSKAMQHATKPPGQWNNLDIVLNKNRIIVIMNGVNVSEYITGNPVPKRQRYSDPKRGGRPIYGYIGIQNHDHDATHPNSHVYFKEISVSPL